MRVFTTGPAPPSTGRPARSCRSFFGTKWSAAVPRVKHSAGIYLFIFSSSSSAAAAFSSVPKNEHFLCCSKYFSELTCSLTAPIE